jgi:hypothetical protein
MARKRATAAGAGKPAKSQPIADPTAEADNSQLLLDRDELVEMMQDCLTNFATEVGLKIACRLLEDEAEFLGVPAAPQQETAVRRPAKRAKALPKR